MSSSTVLEKICQYADRKSLLTKLILFDFQTYGLKVTSLRYVVDARNLCVLRKISCAYHFALPALLA